MILDFSCKITEKLFNGEALRRKEINSLGDCDLKKARQRLETLNLSTEQSLKSLISFKYHRLSGSDYYSIDTKRNSSWRIVFQWKNDEMIDVKLVRLTSETHR